MADPVASREWRQKLREVRHEHTTEVRAETLPVEVEQLIADMAKQMARMHGELADAQKRISAIEAVESDRRLCVLEEFQVPTDMVKEALASLKGAA